MEGEFDDFDSIDDEFEVISLIDDLGNEVEFVVISSVEYNQYSYILCIESELFEDDDANASIFKVTTQDGKEIYNTVEDDEEFDIVAKLFKSSVEDFDLEL